MPNHITNTLTIEGEESEKVIKEITDDKGNIDFNLIIPIPVELACIVAPVSYVDTEEEYMELFARYQVNKATKGNDHELSNGIPITKERQQRYIEEYGSDNWYNWKCDNWGTKWGAYDCSLDDNVITFDTAWSMPQPIYEELSKRYPKTTFHVTWYDENLGSNLGKISFKGDEIFESIEPEDGSSEAFELLFELAPEYIDDFEQVNGEWKWREE